MPRLKPCSLIRQRLQKRSARFPRRHPRGFILRTRVRLGHEVRQKPRGVEALRAQEPQPLRRDLHRLVVEHSHDLPRGVRIDRTAELRELAHTPIQTRPEHLAGGDHAGDELEAESRDGRVVEKGFRERRRHQRFCVAHGEVEGRRELGTEQRAKLRALLRRQLALRTKAVRVLLRGDVQDQLRPRAGLRLPGEWDVVPRRQQPCVVLLLRFALHLLCLLRDGVQQRLPAREERRKGTRRRRRTPRKRRASRLGGLRWQERGHEFRVVFCPATAHHQQLCLRRRVPRRDLRARELDADLHKHGLRLLPVAQRRRRVDVVPRREGLEAGGAVVRRKEVTHFHGLAVFCVEIVDDDGVQHRPRDGRVVRVRHNLDEDRQRQILRRAVLVCVAWLRDEAERDELEGEPFEVLELGARYLVLVVKAQDVRYEPSQGAADVALTLVDIRRVRMLGGR
eukprot:PhM_4_TR5020/c0_g1_i1/m.105878